MRARAFPVLVGLVATLGGCCMGFETQAVREPAEPAGAGGLDGLAVGADDHIIIIERAAAWPGVASGRKVSAAKEYGDFIPGFEASQGTLVARDPYRRPLGPLTLRRTDVAAEVAGFVAST